MTWFDEGSDAFDIPPGGYRPHLKIESLEMLDISAEAYHASDAIGHSSLVRIMRSPAHFHHYRDNPHESTPALEFGTAFHSAILEPALFREIYASAPKFDRRTTEGKANAAQWEIDNLGKRMLTVDQMETLQLMQASVAQHKTASRYMRKGLVEKSFFWTDVETGIECKFRPDFMMLDQDGKLIETASQLDRVEAIIDTKSCLSAEKEAFARSIVKFGYDLQAAFYSDPLSSFLGREIPFYFLAVETTAPHCCALYRAGPRTIEIGRTKYRAGLQLMEWCRRNDAWPGYQPYGDEEVIEVPRWERAIDMDEDV